MTARRVRKKPTAHEQLKLTAQEKFDERMKAANYDADGHLEKPEHMQRIVPLTGLRGATRPSTPMRLEAALGGIYYGDPMKTHPFQEEDHAFVRFLKSAPEEESTPVVEARPEPDIYDRTAAKIRNSVEYARYVYLTNPYVNKSLRPILTFSAQVQEKLHACRRRYRQWRS